MTIDIRLLMNIFRYLSRSFSVRLSLWVTGFVTAIFVVALTLLFRFSLSVVKDEALEQNMEVLEHAALQVDRLLHQTEMTAKTVGWMIGQHRESPTVISSLCHEVMQANPWIDSCYVVPAEKLTVEAACWQEPLLDTASGIVDLKPMVLTYCLPVPDAEGKQFLTLAIDVPIDWKDIIHSHVTEPMPYVRCYLQGPASKDRLESSGYQLHQMEGSKLYRFYRPFANTGWALVMLSHERDIMAGYSRLQTTAILVMITILLLLLLVCRLIIDHNLKPLDLLSVKVRSISQNRFDEPIPAPKRMDEIGELQRSFSTMQESLASYISEMHRKTTELQDRNQALRAAYERGREDERTKTAFLSILSEQIMEPVNEIQASTDRLNMSYQGLTREEMSQLLSQIAANSDTITSLIDQTLLTSQEGGENKAEKGRRQKE